jgi:hypothetical protein
MGGAIVGTKQQAAQPGTSVLDTMPVTRPAFVLLSSLHTLAQPLLSSLQYEVLRILATCMTFFPREL